MFWISGTKSYEAPTRDPDRPKLEFLWFAICSSPLAFPWRWGRWKCCFRLLSWSSFVTFSSDQGSTIWLAMGCTPVMLAQSRVSHFCAPSLRLPEQVLFLLTFALLWRTSLESDLSSIFVGDHSFASKHTQDWLWIGNGEEAFGPMSRGFPSAVALIPNPNGFHNGNPKVTNLQLLLRCLPYLWLLWWDFANCKPHKPLYKSLHTMFDPFFLFLILLKRKHVAFKLSGTGKDCSEAGLTSSSVFLCSRYNPIQP